MIAFISRHDCVYTHLICFSRTSLLIALIAGVYLRRHLGSHNSTRKTAEERCCRAPASGRCWRRGTASSAARRRRARRCTTSPSGRRVAARAAPPLYCHRKPNEIITKCSACRGAPAPRRSKRPTAIRQGAPPLDAGGDAAKFQEASRSVRGALSDTEKRQGYDAYGHAAQDLGGGGDPFEAFRQAFGGQAGGFHFHQQGGGQEPFEDLLNEFFGGGQRRRVRVEARTSS